MAKIVFITDMDMKSSGYFNIAVNLCNGLVERGHEIKIVGLSYKGEEHNFPYSIIPCRDFREAHAMAHNLQSMWGANMVIVGMDIPIQTQFIEAFQQNIKNGMKYIAITAMENGPLTTEWALGLWPAHHIFFISEFAVEEAKKKGLTNVSFINIGVDSEFWKSLTSEGRALARKTLNYGNSFVIITVADNQERKNLWAAFETVRRFRDTTQLPVKFVLVTREKNPYGHKVRDLAQMCDISKELILYERGMSNENLRLLYNTADAFLLLSKAEGLGMPVLEAMSCGVPCVCTDTGAMHELLDEGRGLLVKSAYRFVDVWGNSYRDMADIDDAAGKLMEIVGNVLTAPNKARLYIEEKRKWDVTDLDNKIKELTDGK